MTLPVLSSEEDRVLKAIEEKLNSIETLSVEFVQEVNSGVFATIEKTEGKIYLADGDRFRIETDEQVIVSDSVFLWVYSVENKQVKIDSVDEVEDMVKPSDYLFSFKEDYNADLTLKSECDFGECLEVVLKSKQKDNFIKQMKLYIEADTYLTHRAEYTDINGNLVTVKFDKYKLNNKIPRQIFQFKTPKGVEEIRLP
jgi:outer membrane lipoprotein carrier protein